MAIGTTNITATNYIGRLSWEVTDPYPTSFTQTSFSYDPMGRINESWSCTNVTCSNPILSITYTYNMLGDETGRGEDGPPNYTSQYDVAGRLISFTNSSSNTRNPGNLLSGATYDPFGHMNFGTLANGLSETWKYDNRGRLVAEASGTGCTSGAGTCTTSKYSLAVTYLPNGNVQAANDSANGNWTYTYDDFNRLISSVGGPSNSSYAYQYDRFGNRWNQKLNGACTAGTTACVTFDANNHINNGAQTYDAAGNVLSDALHHYAYDAENRIKSIDSGATTYFYDAEGRRAQKNSNGALAMSYAYDRNDATFILFGPTISLYEEIYVAGMHLATYTTTAAHNATDLYFHHNDWLGTERARTDYAGNLCETTSSLPFGDGQTTSSTCAEGDISPMHFTGKERDSESGLDNFGARYNSSNLGRFMSPDWSESPEDVASANFSNPQTLNLYSYVGNNPLTLTDPNGHEALVSETADPGVVSDGSSGTYNVTHTDPSGEQVAKLQDTTQNAQTAQPQADANTALVAAPATQQAVEKVTQQEVDKFAEPLIESAVEKGGTAIAKGIGIVVAVVAEATVFAPSAGAHESEMLNAIRKKGPSGKPVIHKKNFPSKKRARDAARNARGARGWPQRDGRKSGFPAHFHSVDRNGERIKDGVHYNYFD